ncbi:MAG: FtsX-like permease family protein [Verrucomicrobia bacterium]|jgi:hypothetical protein|nr:FtsX-like permease family protein [Verrucomicrobiota bacterium]MBT7068219.1 FtsX-like permease family protein [Verrucomicrobiota bacterium]MBT7699034.1 FtsX-like permease family protein [Verrucomicrobiota bacterium]
MSNQKNIDVRDQVTLSFEKSFRFCRKGISYRLFRSSLTLAVVVVAVAFFTVLVSESLMLRSTSVGVHDEMGRAREADTTLMHLFHRYSSRDLSAKLAGLKDDPAAVAEFAQVAGVSVEMATDLATQCYVEQLFLHFFRTLSPGKRVVLVKKHTGRATFEFLSGTSEWDAFVVDLAKMRSVRLPTPLETLRTFLDNREVFLASLQTVREARDQTVTALEVKLDGLTGDADAAAWLGQASDADVAQWRTIVTASGFDLDPDAMRRIQEVLRVTALENRISKWLQSPQNREAWKVKLQTTPGLETKLLMLKDQKVAALVGDTFSAEERAAVADRFLRVKHLRELVGKLPRVEDTGVAPSRFMDGRQMFLVIISFLVCMVGITNAMLMSITERFREIATMKCLGATDGFILKQFLIEAAIQGVIGGTAGMLIGMIISVVKSWILLGGAVLAHLPGLQMLICAVATVVIGILLAMLASIYPARAAARMAPMDAMRVE